MKRITIAFIIFLFGASQAFGIVDVQPPVPGQIAVFDKDGAYQKTIGVDPRTTNGAFYAPSGMCFDKSGNLFVVDNRAHKVVKMSAEGQFLQSFGTPGAGGVAGRLNYPYAIACDAQGNMYVTDGSNGRVQKLNPADGTWTIIGGAIDIPWGIAISGSGDVFVSEYGTKKVLKLNGAVWEEYIPAMANAPRGLAVDSSGNLYVCNDVNPLKFGPDKALIVGFVPNPTLRAPFVAIDGSGNLFFPTIYENDNSKGYRVWKLKSDGTVISSNVGNTTWGLGAGQMRSPQGCVVDAAGNVFVGDTGNSRVLKFAPQ